MLGYLFLNNGTANIEQSNTNKNSSNQELIAKITNKVTEMENSTEKGYTKYENIIKYINEQVNFNHSNSEIKQLIETNTEKLVSEYVIYSEELYNSKKFSEIMGFWDSGKNFFDRNGINTAKFNEKYTYYKKVTPVPLTSLTTFKEHNPSSLSSGTPITVMEEMTTNDSKTLGKGLMYKNVMTGNDIPYSFTYLIDNNYSKIEGIFALSSLTKNTSSMVILELIGDNSKSLGKWGMHTGARSIDISVDLTGIKELQVVFEYSGNSLNPDNEITVGFENYIYPVKD